MTYRPPTPISFTLPERPAGYALQAAGKGEIALVQCAEIIPATEPTSVQDQLMGLHAMVFRHIPGLPDPSQINHILVVIRGDLSGEAYVNDLRQVANVKLARAVKAGDLVRDGDVSDIVDVDLGVVVPDDCGVVYVMSHLWKRAVYFDFFPLHAIPQPRIGPLGQVAAQLALSLVGLPERLGESLPKTVDPFAPMSAGFQKLSALTKDEGTAESEIQELLHEHPWILGGHFRDVTRHRALDDRNIPDFTATRISDGCLDVIEIKLPTAMCCRRDGNLSSAFNDAWNQVERYLRFVDTNRDYLLREKQLRFENAKATLVIGRALTDNEIRLIREKESFNGRITVLSYDQLLEQARRILGFVRGASLGVPRLDGT